MRKRDEYNNRYSSSSPTLSTETPTDPHAAVNEKIELIARECDHSSAVAIDSALRTVREDSELPYFGRRRFLDQLRAQCPYDKRQSFLLAVCEASEFEFDGTVDLISDCVEEWKSSSSHLIAASKIIVERLFEFKGSQLFDLRYSSITRYIRKLSEFCADPSFVLNLVLRTAALEQLDLNGDEWLQLATSLSEHTSPQASMEALELLLSGSALRIADEIGEGPFRTEFAISGNQAQFLAGIIWHLLGDDDGYVRWAVARALTTLPDLGLEDDLKALLGEFDQMQVAALSSPDARLSFQNSQQWLLMGLARAAFYHGPKLGYLRPTLLALAGRDDTHAVHKLQIAKCLENISGTSVLDPDLDGLWDVVKTPSCGFIEIDDWPTHTEPQRDFGFDYEFDKSEISGLARLFGISHGQASDAVAAEIRKKWPEATSLDFFPGHERYRRDSDDRYELYREHIQKHALISATSTLARTHPVATRSYDSGENTAWADWLDQFDTTFNDGTWLSDRKDAVPQPAKLSLLGPRDDSQETLKDHETLLNMMGLAGSDQDAFVPIYADWTSPDGVHVSIVSALSARLGAIGECERFSKRNRYDLWLPQFWDGGYFDKRHRQSSPYDPLIWAPEDYGLGIDVGDEIAARKAAARPRLGIELTQTLEISSDEHSGEWRTTDGTLALKSQVWGSWEPDSDQHRNRYHNGGELLWSSPKWLDGTLSKLGKRLVYSITFNKYPSSRRYGEERGVKAVFVGLRMENSQLRVWPAKKASIQDY